MMASAWSVELIKTVLGPVLLFTHVIKAEASLTPVKEKRDEMAVKMNDRNFYAINIEAVEVQNADSKWAWGIRIQLQVLVTI